MQNLSLYKRFLRLRRIASWDVKNQYLSKGERRFIFKIDKMIKLARKEKTHLLFSKSHRDRFNEIWIFFIKTTEVVCNG